MTQRCHRRYAALAGGILVVAIALTLATRSGSANAPAAEPPPVLAVRTVLATEASWPQGVPAVGSIAAWQEVVIGAELGGQRLAQLLVDVGDPVRRGDLLAVLGSGTLQAELEASRAALREAEALALEAGRAAERARSLQGTEVLSAQAIDEAIAASEAAQARLASARARLRADELRLSWTRIHSPDDGVISARAAVEGALVQAGDELLRLQRQGRLEWHAELPAADLARIAPGMAVRVDIDGEASIEGRVRRVSPQVDPAKRSGVVFVELGANPLARAGMFARGEIQAGERNVLTLPESALLLRDGFAYVFRVEGDMVRQQKVEPGARRGGRVEVRAGLDAATPVVESGVAFLADGVAVRVVPSPSASSS